MRTNPKPFVVLSAVLAAATLWACGGPPDQPLPSTWTTDVHGSGSPVVGVGSHEPAPAFSATDLQRTSDDLLMRMATANDELRAENERMMRLILKLKEQLDAARQLIGLPQIGHTLPQRADGSTVSLRELSDALRLCYLTRDGQDLSACTDALDAQRLWEMADGEPRFRARLQEVRNAIPREQRDFVWPSQRDDMLRAYLDDLIAQGIPPSLAARYRAELLEMFP